MATLNVPYRKMNFRMPEALLVEIDEWRRHEADLPTVNEAVRRLLKAGLGQPTKSRPLPRAA
jgi:hypothetical protein